MDITDLLEHSLSFFFKRFAKTYLLNGGDIFSLQKILGHADIATIKNYLNLNEKEIKSQHAKFNPLDNRTGFIDIL